MVVTVFDLCPICNTLHKEVKERYWSNYSWIDPKSVKITSCQKCFDIAVAEKQREPFVGVLETDD